MASWLAPKFYEHFPKWDYPELLSEIYMLLVDRLDRWDPDKGNLATYGLKHFWDPLSTRYHRDQGVRVYRPKNGKRQYLPNLDFLDKPYWDKERLEIPWGLLTKRETGFLQLRGRGYTLNEIAKANGLTESRVCQLFIRIKEKLDGSFDPYSNC